MNISNLVKQQLKRQGLTVSDLARLIQQHPSTTIDALKRPSIQTGKLIRISEVLHYNFFREIAEKLPIQEPTYESIRDIEAAKTQLLERIKALELENSILRQTLKDITSR